ncbi:four helix bundle protein [Polaribacter batillariae]|uniref:Four helix bundle protein n=1 Tax=Polaribacter batillariae TaxID=2808900 RepID=A0ABX7STP0_9FLAO|nr:four helix bundle protein [Polaribacter batillariae]QTD36193.1 four helix bundle protein [Polaribacter batillariae]
MYVFSFEKLKVWQEAIDLSMEVYSISINFPADEKYGITSQLKRATNSISANIAEGTSRITNKDKAHFSTIAFSTTMEVLNHIILCYKLKFIDETTYNDIRQRIYKISNMLNALRKSQLNN